ncbi:LysE family translocator [Escherichia coli]|uniref:LysE family translocator n=1 Tax=Escherichia coli TaxID=562 RepID=UPI001C293638|nr:LysE family translocator [Escherichia coli]MEB6105930.1 LysE family translocator [Escherichia coli]HAW0482324.1 LysE family translocator [Escherichia coli]HBC0854871.1 LysE family translocator [Escherichia coli]HBH5279712.1 LysE family translocator [Escherichia coli]
MDFTTLVTFTIITLSQTVSIGPGVALIISESLVYGAKKAITTSIYIRFGEIVVMLITLFSITQAINLEKHLNAIKICGGGYLIFLGITGLIKKKNPKKNRANIPCLIPLLNPRTFLFFAAFMPSFIKDNSNFNTDFLLLCGVFIIISLLTDLIYICICLTLRERIRTSLSKYVNFISSLFILITGACLVLL